MKLGQVQEQPLGLQAHTWCFAGTPLVSFFAQVGPQGTEVLTVGSAPAKAAAADTEEPRAPSGEPGLQRPHQGAGRDKQPMLSAPSLERPPLPLPPLVQPTLASLAPATLAAPLAWPLRRRLVGKQTPPSPNPWLASARQAEARSRGCVEARPADTKKGHAPQVRSGTASGSNSSRKRTGSPHRVHPAPGDAGHGKGGKRAKPKQEARRQVSAAPPTTKAAGGNGSKRARTSQEASRQAPAPPAIVKAPPARSSPRKALADQQRQPCFTATGLELGEKLRRLIECKLGARLVDEWSADVTHLVSDTFRRTTKFMCAICAGVRIVVPEYLEACRVAGQLVDDADFALRDEVCEAAFAKKHGLPGYSLAAALQRAREAGPMLAGYSVHCAPSVTGRPELRVLVEAAGGRWLRRAEAATKPLVTAGNGSGTLLVGREYDAELLREAACTQVLRFDTYRL